MCLGDSLWSFRGGRPVRCTNDSPETTSGTGKGREEREERAGREGSCLVLKLGDGDMIVMVDLVKSRNSSVTRSDL